MNFMSLCDYTRCNYTSLGNDICNPQCHTEECLFDYCDCFDFDSIVDDGDISINSNYNTNISDNYNSN